MSEKVLPLYLSAELKEKLKKMADKKNLSQNSIIRLALTEYIERNS